MDPITLAALIGGGVITVGYATLNWYRDKEKRDVKKIDLKVFAAENSLNFDQGDEQFVKETIKTHQIRPQYPFVISNVFQTGLENATAYIFDYNLSDARYTRSYPQKGGIYRHVILIDFAKQTFPRFKITHLVKPEELFRSGDMPIVSKSELPYWLQEDITVYAPTNKKKDVLEFIEGKAGLEPLLSDPKLEELFFSSQYVGIFLTGSLRPKIDYFNVLEDYAGLLVKIFGDKSNKGDSKIEKLKQNERNQDS